jgi:2-oxoglutarate ferredoxin oxidoreductase subunit alpha
MTEVPCVIVDVQRGGPSTGLPTHASQGDVMQVRWGTHGDHSIVCLTASNHQELFAIMVDAFNFSEIFRTPVVVLIDEILGHMRERIHIPEEGELDLTERLVTTVPRDVDYHPYFPREDGRLPMSHFGGDHRYNVTGLFHDMWGFPSDKPSIANDLLHHLINKIENRKRMLVRHKEYNLEDAEIVLISYGSSARSAKHIMENRRAVGMAVGMIELQTLWPFPNELIRERCKTADYVVVVEMNMGQIVHLVKAAVERPHRVFLSNRVDGEMITPTDIKNLIRVIQGKGV